MQSPSSSPTPASLGALLILLVGAGGLVAPAGAAEKLYRPSVERLMKNLGYEPIVLERDEHNHLTVNGRLGEKRNRYLIDTGFSVTTVDTLTGRRLKTVKELNARIDDPVLGVITDDDTVLLDKVQIGRVEFTNVPANRRSLDKSGLPFTEGVVLGADFLYRNHAVIDCLDRRLYLRGAAPPKEAKAALEESLRRAGFFAVPIERSLFLTPVCSTRINDRPVRLMVDTGAVWTLLDDSQIRPLGLDPKPSTYRVVGVGKIGSSYLDVATVDTWQVGDLTLRKVRLGVAEMEAWGIAESRRQSASIVGLLGGDQLTANAALIDLSSMTMWLDPSDAKRGAAKK